MDDIELIQRLAAAKQRGPHALSAAGLELGWLPETTEHQRVIIRNTLAIGLADTSKEAIVKALKKGDRADLADTLERLLEADDDPDALLKALLVAFRAASNE